MNLKKLTKELSAVLKNSKSKPWSKRREMVGSALGVFTGAVLDHIEMLFLEGRKNQMILFLIKAIRASEPLSRNGISYYDGWKITKDWFKEVIGQYLADSDREAAEISMIAVTNELNVAQYLRPQDYVGPLRTIESVGNNVPGEKAKSYYITLVSTGHAPHGSVWKNKRSKVNWVVDIDSKDDVVILEREDSEDYVTQKVSLSKLMSKFERVS